MNYPKIYLAIDNCFASKRWTEPSDWMRVIRELGLYHVEASADTECDPLYMGRDYLTRWVEKVKNASTDTGVKVANLYSGHGTYATLGLAHTDVAIRRRFLDEWLKPMAENAGLLGAGLGFFCHAFSEAVLQSPEQYSVAEQELYSALSKLAGYAASQGCAAVGVEQMYTPHQIPWTIAGAEKLLRETNKKQTSPFYITIDVGHQCGQRRFLRPSREQLNRAFVNGSDDLWLGPASAYESIFRKSGVEKIEAEMDKYPYLFAEYEDGNPYLWLQRLGCYSPIIHLQQTNGKSSSHLPFTKEHNAAGIINGPEVLRSLMDSYSEGNTAHGMPQKCGEIYFTLEMFSGTAEKNRDILKRLKESVTYWRQFIPKDGLTLDQLIKSGEK